MLLENGIVGSLKRVLFQPTLPCFDTEQDQWEYDFWSWTPGDGTTVTIERSQRSRIRFRPIGLNHRSCKCSHEWWNHKYLVTRHCRRPAIRRRRHHMDASAHGTSSMCASIPKTCMCVCSSHTFLQPICMYVRRGRTYSPTDRRRASVRQPLSRLGLG